jgi:hypothetical protein
MSAQMIIDSLWERDIAITLNGDRLKVDAPAGALTDEDRQAIRDHKAELLALLRAKPAERPRSGSFACPVICRGDRMPMGCPWDTCNGALTGKGHDLYHCGKCETWLRLLPPEDPGVYVGDLASDFGAVATEGKE